MANRLGRWTYRGVTTFLAEKGFQFFDDVEGVGKAWMNFHENGEPNRIVEVKPTGAFYAARTLKRMIRQSGIPENEWITWAGPDDGGFN